MAAFNNITIKGKTIDDLTRCEHYHSPLDIIAIKFKCCNEYYPCYYCHQGTSDHLVQVWKKNEHSTKAIFCGICKHEMTIKQYLTCDNKCPFCNNKFNPNCSNHYHFYFEK